MLGGEIDMLFDLWVLVKCNNTAFDQTVLPLGFVNRIAHNRYGYVDLKGQDQTAS